jgi:hypothetical protein
MCITADQFTREYNIDYMNLIIASLIERIRGSVLPLTQQSVLFTVHKGTE